MHWERTSQLPELGVSLSASDPCSLPKGLLARKFPELSTCNVTLITQREEQRAGHWSHLLSLAGWLSLSVSLSEAIFLIWAYQNQNFPTENKQERVNPLDSNCPQGLTHLSEPTRDSWNEEGCHDNSSTSCPMGEKEETPFSLPSGSFLTLLSRRNCPTRAH